MIPGRGWMEIPPDPDFDPVMSARAVLFGILLSIPIWIVIGLLWWWLR